MPLQGTSQVAQTDLWIERESDQYRALNAFMGDRTCGDRLLGDRMIITEDKQSMTSVMEDT